MSAEEGKLGAADGRRIDPPVAAYAGRPRRGGNY
jgi:hypothetical protein